MISWWWFCKGKNEEKEQKEERKWWHFWWIQQRWNLITRLLLPLCLLLLLLLPKLLFLLIFFLLLLSFEKNRQFCARRTANECRRLAERTFRATLCGSGTEFLSASFPAGRRRRNPKERSTRRRRVVRVASVRPCGVRLWWRRSNSRRLGGCRCVVVLVR